jgi:hypothetical protein
MSFDCLYCRRGYGTKCSCGKLQPKEIENMLQALNCFLENAKNPEEVERFKLEILYLEKLREESKS